MTASPGSIHHGAGLHGDRAAEPRLGSCGWFSEQAGLRSFRSQFIRTCCATQRALSLRMTATTLAPSPITSGLSREPKASQSVLRASTVVRHEAPWLQEYEASQCVTKCLSELGPWRAAWEVCNDPKSCDCRSGAFYVSRIGQRDGTSERPLQALAHDGHVRRRPGHSSMCMRF